MATDVEVVDPLLKIDSPRPPIPPPPPVLASPFSAAQLLANVGTRIIVFSPDAGIRTLSFAGMKELAATWQKRKSESSQWVDAQGLTDSEQSELLVALGMPASVQAWEAYQESFRTTAVGKFMTVMEMVRDQETKVYREKPFRIACFPPDLLLTCHSQPTPSVTSTLSMIRQAREKRHGPVTINALLMRELTGSYTALADTVQSEVETLGGLVLQLPSREETDLLWRVTQVRSQLLLLSEAVYRKERVIKILSINTEWHSRTHRKAMQSARNSLLRFRDQATLSQNQVKVWLNPNRPQELLANITGTYLGRVSLAEAETGARTGVITRHLNSMYVMMLPLLVVQGCFSMNVRVPGQLVDNLDWFFGIVAVQVVFIFIMFAVLRRLNWF